MTSDAQRARVEEELEHRNRTRGRGQRVERGQLPQPAYVHARLVERAQAGDLILRDEAVPNGFPALPGVQAFSSVTSGVLSAASLSPVYPAARA
jgi:hypothetical protein